MGLGPKSQNCDAYHTVCLVLGLVGIRWDSVPNRRIATSTTPFAHFWDSLGLVGTRPQFLESRHLPHRLLSFGARWDSLGLGPKSQNCDTYHTVCSLLGLVGTPWDSVPNPRIATRTTPFAQFWDSLGLVGTRSQIPELRHAPHRLLSLGTFGIHGDLLPL